MHEIKCACGKPKSYRRKADGGIEFPPILEHVGECKKPANHRQEQTVNRSQRRVSPAQLSKIS
jgi:hypothetical protein